MREALRGRWLISVVAALTTMSGFVADWNRTHLFNPRWSPHAKFHDAQTVLLGTFLGGGSLYILWRGEGDTENHLNVSTFLLAAFWLAQGGSFLFPGTGGLETEFPDKVPRIAGVRLNEAVSSSFMLGLLALGYWMAHRDKTGK
ncbi:MAG: hypothetical protein M3220_05415 [Chloroflexota bacterium]|nr:hypothetical protein [Chloroflexota bacterium]